MRHIPSIKTLPSTESLSPAAKAVPVLVAALLGVFILYGVGFASSQVLHNAAHDGRHAFAFPCH
ncbi:MAG: cobalt transporter subunit [Rhodospirillaceae bacterium]|jgi:cobalt transporter subunit CbtB|nr:cobalt transporter subunit [Rhodospirillaceae bacterium]